MQAFLVTSICRLVLYCSAVTEGLRTFAIWVQWQELSPGHPAVGLPMAVCIAICYCRGRAASNLVGTDWALPAARHARR